MRLRATPVVPPPVVLRATPVVPPMSQPKVVYPWAQYELGHGGGPEPRGTLGPQGQGAHTRGGMARMGAQRIP